MTKNELKKKQVDKKIRASKSASNISRKSPVRENKKSEQEIFVKQQQFFDNDQLGAEHNENRITAFWNDLEDEYPHDEDQATEET